MLLGAGLAGAAGSALIPLAAGSPVAFGLLLLVWGGIAGTLYTVGLAMLGDRTPANDLAGANAAFVVLYNVGLMLGPPVIGGGLDLVPPHGFALALLALFLAFAGWLAATDRTRPRS